jgi:hypothetical protein
MTRSPATPPGPGRDPAPDGGEAARTPIALVVIYLVILVWAILGWIPCGAD